VRNLALIDCHLLTYASARWPQRLYGNLARRAQLLSLPSPPLLFLTLLCTTNDPRSPGSHVIPISVPEPRPVVWQTSGMARNASTRERRGPTLLALHWRTITHPHRRALAPLPPCSRPTSAARSVIAIFYGSEKSASLYICCTEPSCERS